MNSSQNEADLIDAEVVDEIVLSRSCAPEDDVRNLPVLYGGKYYRNREPKEPSAHRESQLASRPERRCVAKKTNGEQCRRWAIKGSTVCKMHGGAAPQVLAKAKARIQNNADKITKKEIEFVFDEGIPANVRLNAAQDLLDRAGLIKTQQVEIGPPKPYEQIFDSISAAPLGPHAETFSGEPLDAGCQVSGQTSPASAGFKQTSTDDPAATCVDADCDPPDCTQSDEPSCGDGLRRPKRRKRSRSGHHITGEVAMEVAAQINAVRALPPGRRR